MKSVIVLFLIVLIGTAWAATSDQQDNLYRPAEGYNGVQSPDQVLEFFDSFEAYVASTPLTVQTNKWVTWDLTHGGTNDPFVSNAQAYSGSNSVVIVQDNDLVRDIGAPVTSGTWRLSWQMYIPTGKAGYFNTLATFDPPGHANTNWGLEVYFDVGGGGRCLGGSSTAVTFSWTAATWTLVEVIVDLDNDLAEFWFNGSMVHSWQWTLGASGGGSPLQLQANDFYGATADDEMYFDDYSVEKIEPDVLFSDNFDGYTPGFHLALQNPVHWTTWSNAPGGSEDALVSNTYFNSDSNSVVITQNNDLVKIFDSAPITTGKWEISFNIYIPTGKAGYFNTLAQFSPPSTFNWGVEVYFDAGGGGRCLGGSSTAVTFSWTENTWQPVTVIVDLNSDLAEFWFNGSLVHSWQWTLGASGGSSPLQIDANDFYGGTANDEMYFDDYVVREFLVVAPPKLLLSEIVAQPTDAEYVEIYNPGAVEVDLSNYYLGNSTYQFGGDYYYQIVEGGGGGGSFADFIARFPDGASIQPGEYQTVACAGDSLFFDAYGVMPTYELYEDSTNTSDVPDMREATPGSINGQGGLTDSDEDVILFNWDGMSDLVWDVDYLIYDNGGGTINEQVDKTGVSIDGPDPGTDSTMYLPDTPIANQVPAPINSTANGYSSHRIDYTEGTQIMSGGNGCTGADETSENLDSTWTDDSVPTPNGPWVSATQPVISVTPTSITDSVAVNDSMDVNILIFNTGDAVLDWSASINQTAKTSVDMIAEGSARDAEILAIGTPVSLDKLESMRSSFSISAEDIGDMGMPYQTNGNSGMMNVNKILGEEVFGSAQNAYGPSGTRGRGNLFTCTTTSVLTEHRLYLNVTVSTTMYFVVAESNTQVGDYTLISASDVSPSGTGAGWYSSGPINVPMVAGRYYLIFAQWEDPATYYNEQNISPYPIQASFGELTAGAGFSSGSLPAYSVPPATTHPITAGAFGSPVAYYQTIVTQQLAPFIKLIEPTSGSIDPFDVQTLGVRIYGLDVSDTTYTADIEIASNDLNNPVVTVPVEIMVKDSITSVSILDPVPSTYAISQNYPNPFNPTTTIKYQVPQASQVTINIYNLLGQKVRTLVNEKMEPGYHQVEWNGLNDVGVKVGSGVYFYRFQADKFIDIKKMLLLK